MLMVMERDEIIYGSMVVDDNGKGFFSTGFRHGDAIHVGDLDSGPCRDFKYLEFMKLKEDHGSGSICL